MEDPEEIGLCETLTELLGALNTTVTDETTSKRSADINPGADPQPCPPHFALATVESALTPQQKELFTTGHEEGD